MKENPVIGEIDEITKLTTHQIALNKIISSNFTEKEQEKMYKLLRTMLVDEIVFLISIMKKEKEIRSEIND